MARQSLTVYQIRNLNDGKVYIGQTSKAINRRLSTHFARAKRGECPTMRFYNAIREQGRSAFVIEPIAYATNRAELDYLEEYFIITKNADEEGNGYNMREGGRRIQGRFVTEESKRKISIGNLGKPKSAAHRAALSIAQRARFIREGCSRA